MLSFQANTVSVDYDENDVLIVGFADLQDDGETNHYFMIQHTDEYDKQDAELGMDTYYIERDDQGYSTYGGIRQIRLSPSQVTVELDEVGSKQLEVPQVVIGLNLQEEEYVHLKDHLKKIFDEQTLSIN
jgi:hypothetical protein